MEQIGLGVHILPIGQTDPTQGPWEPYNHLFRTLLKPVFINVVCFPSGFLLPSVTRAQETAISGLFTVGVPNIAICESDFYLKKEIAMLSLYQHVICPTPEKTEILSSQGIAAETIPPSFYDLEPLLRNL